MIEQGQLGVMQLLAGMIAAMPDPTGSGVGAGDFETLNNGVAATIHAPTGDRYRVSVEWLGDDESDA